MYLPSARARRARGPSRNLLPPGRLPRAVPGTAADLARIRAALAPEPVRPALPPGASAVLLPLVHRDGALSVVFTRRASHLARHPGQISFPGGGIEPQDKGPAEAALRETEEEVGIPARSVEVLGHLADYTTYYGRLVCCYVGAVGPDAPPPRIAAPDEVAEVLVLPIARFLEGAEYEARYLPGDPRRDGVVHYWRFPGLTPPVWGITAELMARFLQRCYAWSPPREPRAIASVEEFRTGL